MYELDSRGSELDDRGIVCENEGRFFKSTKHDGCVGSNGE